MKRTLIFIISIFSLYSLNYSQPQYDLLEKAYKENSATLLDSFFINWQNEIKPITQEELNQQNDTVKAVYELYSNVFNKRNELYHVVVSNFIDYDFVDHIYIDYWKEDSLKKIFSDNESTANYDTIPNTILRIGCEPKLFVDSIINFRPNKFLHLTPLFLNKKYKAMLNKFLFGVDGENGMELIQKSRRSMEKVGKRLGFLNNYLNIGSPYHGGWHWETEPEVYHVSFNKNLTRARVFYLENCNIWFAFFILQNNSWVLIKKEEVICVCG